MCTPKIQIYERKKQIPKLKQLARGEIIGKGNPHLERLVEVDTNEPTSYTRKWTVSAASDDRVSAYLVGNTLHFYGYSKMCGYSSLSAVP